MIVVAHISLFTALYIAVCLFVSLPCVVLFVLMATRLNKHYYYIKYVLCSVISINQPINARFVGRRYTTCQSRRQSVISTIKSTFLSRFLNVLVSVSHEGRMTECSRWLDRSRRSHVQQILFLFLAERKPLSQSVFATGCRNCANFRSNNYTFIRIWVKTMSWVAYTILTRNAFCGTWYLPHSHVHNERTVPIIMSGCIVHARNGRISTSGEKI